MTMKAEFINDMGDDLTVVNAARVSLDKESSWLIKGKPDKVEFGVHYPITIELKDEDKKLIHYLAKHGHFTPFTHCAVTLRETVPIFVARQRFKHTVGFSYNEVSRRYVHSDPEFFVPKGWRKASENIKQGSLDEFVSNEGFGTEFWTIGENTVSGAYKRFLHHAESLYKDMLEHGICPEQARMVLPQSMYTSYYVTGSLYAWARAYNLRSDKHAQKEIRDLASQWDAIIRPSFPVSWAALTETEYETPSIPNLPTIDDPTPSSR